MLKNYNIVRVFLSTQKLVKGEKANMKKVYYSANDLVDMLDISKASAYKIIRQLNDELKALGFIVLQGKVPKAYFEQKWYGFNSKSLTESA